LLLAAMALPVGAAAPLAAWGLLKLIAICTNIAYYQTFSTVMPTFPAVLPLWSIAVPVVGGLIIGLMAGTGPRKSAAMGFPRLSRPS
jgi:hypothetical protein